MTNGRLMTAMGRFRPLAGSSETADLAQLTATTTTQPVSLKKTEPVLARPNPALLRDLSLTSGLGIRVNFQSLHGTESVEPTSPPADPV